MNNHVILDITGDAYHYWSPQLHFRVEPHESDTGKAVVAGLIGPRPPVWTMFMFVYSIIGFAGFVISMYGVSKWMLGEYSHFLLAFPIALLIMLTAYIAGKFGERLGKDQIELLKQFVRDAIAVENKENA